MPRFEAQDAFAIFIDKFLVDEFMPETYQGKKYFQVGWCGEDHVATALCTTQLQGDGKSGWVPFGLQDVLLRAGKVSEVLLFCKQWDYYYRIPATTFRNFDTTIQDDRRLFNVSRDGELSSEGTSGRIDLMNYRLPLET